MLSRRRILLIVSLVLLASTPLIVWSWHVWERQRLIDRSRLAASKYQWDSLKELATQWTRLDPSNAEAWMLLGRAANARREWPEAVEAYWQIPDSDRSAVPALLEVSHLAFGPLNDPLKGIEASERIIRIDPNESGAQQQLIMIYAATLQRQRLLRQVHAAIEARCEPPEAYGYDFLGHTFRLNDAVPLIDRWLKRYPDEEAFVVAKFLLQIETSNAASDVGTLPHASSPDYPTRDIENSKMEQVNELLKRFPLNEELLAFKANLCISTGNQESATAILSQIPESFLDDARFWRLKGWVHESNEDLDAARKSYQRALELRAIDWNAMVRLTVIERREQHFEEVKRLTDLVERALDLRNRIRGSGGLEKSDISLSVDLARFYKDCGEKVVGPAIERHIARRSQPQSPRTFNRR